MNTNTPVVFNFNQSEVRTLVKDDEPWFVASDVCKALGYQNTSKAVGDHLDADERDSAMVPTPNAPLGVPTNIISESGLYALVLRSRKPEARKFAKWVTSEVLPSIRKTGKYDIATITPAQQCDLQSIVATISPDGKRKAAIWSRFNNHFKLGSYKQLLSSKIDEARTYLIETFLDGEYIESSEEDLMREYVKANSASIVDIKAKLKLGLSEPSLPLPAEVEMAMNAKSFAVAQEFLETFRKHLAGKIAFNCELGQPRYLHKERAMQIINDSSIDTALSHHYYGLLENIYSVSETLQIMSNRYREDIAEELGKRNKALAA